MCLSRRNVKILVLNTGEVPVHLADIETGQPGWDGRTRKFMTAVMTAGWRRQPDSLPLATFACSN